MNISSEVAVYGATGHTGSFVVQELVRRGVPTVAVGRDAGRLEALSRRWPEVTVRRAALDDAAAVASALGGVRALINCAGPFLDTAGVLARAAVRCGVHYVDVTAEQASAADTLGHLDEVAREAGVMVVPGVGFYGGFVDLLVSAAARDSAVVDDVVVAIALSGWHPTLGTRETGARNTAPRMTIRGGSTVPLDEADSPASWTFTAPFGRCPMTAIALSEVPLLGRHLSIGDLTVLLSTLALADLADPSTPPPVPLDDLGRSDQRFVVDARVLVGGRRRQIVAEGRDIYAFTAPLAVEIVSRILERTLVRGGCFAPAQLVDSVEVLASLAECVPEFRVTIGDA